MMSELQILLIITVLGCVSYGLRAGGYLAASLFPAQGKLARVLRVAPGNLFVAFAAAGMWQGHWPAIAGSLSTVAVMALTRKEWAALGAGFLAVALVSLM
jgi:uncharacterized membrane protein